ncbi:hypothetical protein WSK_1254 [Novosphingobium sp. Rr 2-17]|uniref:TonB-dependent receptor domain-containing protein n=1 Tax=Novosphingobium sp. Rr 2-17 TaxID=555793 RepID=UPI0002697B33|nr:TonB-dependent receptor [Novosphingobium sp. Rr 2-17]EIZ80220.1 hypothetical protein WSK_1254 [Novosphingobium sp. Rr 2-17]
MVGQLWGKVSLGSLIAATACSFCSVPSYAAPVQAFSVPAGALSDALLVLSQQAGISIAVDPHLEKLRTRGLSGRYEVSEALRQLLAGSGYDFTFVGARTVRVTKRAAPPPVVVARPLPVPVKVPQPTLAPDVSGPDIYVTATKQRRGLQDYPASIAVVEPDRSEMARAGGDGTNYILGKLLDLAATNLGPGRNKIFIRGLADSSFNGTSQATISQYLGDMRLIYGAPDPDLALHDIQRVEVLEGPQGTLYGAGTLGGIIRLVPTPPDLGKTTVDAAAGLRLTQDGDPGWDGAVTVNVPLVTDRLAVRAVGYRTVEGGYIDDAERKLSDVNRNIIEGVRVAARWQPDPAWTIDLNLVGQNLHSRDGQYTLKGEADLTRSSAIAQPFENYYRLAGVTISRDWGDIKLVSSTAYSHQAIDTVFDATTATSGGVREYQEDIRVQLLSHETRLSGQWGGTGTWLIGVGILDNNDRAVRSLGAPGALATLSNVANDTLDAAVFGEAGVPVLRNLELHVGGRLSYVYQSSEFVGHESGDEFEPVRHQTRVLPSAALSWRPGSGWLVYARYQEGYRPGGLQVTGSASKPTVDRFVSDRIQTFEIGARFGTDKGSRLSGSIAASSAGWHNIQADLVGSDGLPYVANIGSGRVRNLSASFTWRPIEGLSLEAAGFINASGLTHPAAGFDDASDRDLPSIADNGWRTAATYTTPVGNAELTIDTALRYVGHSKLAISSPFALSQGRYYNLSTGARLGFGRWGLSLDLDNALNDRGNTFAYGNPFTVTQGMQQTPMRPRSLRIGIDAQF